ncbi:MAG: hypothetical protein WJ306_03295 [Ferrovum myxofaciens]|uniref:hypothetical protein n=1 Tax=Ferrovum myxofaciens TaxID=416213 RepID=UPI003EC08809
MKTDLLLAEKTHLGNLLEAIQRCVYFLDATSRKLPWLLNGQLLSQYKKDEALFEALSAFNERFSKLQDMLAAAMRHAQLLLGEPGDSFLKVLTYYEKHAVIDSIDSWQLLRAARNLAAHDYEIDYAEIADHFNSLYELLKVLYRTSRAFVLHCDEQLGIKPGSMDFNSEFFEITSRFSDSISSQALSVGQVQTKPSKGA